jgi:predicted RNA-binding Zn-ribbon protein involved in translation (DUF1610 family)
MIGDTDICPACGSDELYRSRTKTHGEKVLRFILPLHYYRCTACGWRKPLLNRESIGDWRRRIFMRVIPILLGLLLVGGFFYLAMEGSREVMRPTTAAGHSGRKR